MHRIRLRLAALGPISLLASVAAAQGTGTLRGSVVDSVTHQPIARVLVLPSVSAEGSVSAALTDATGHFTFTNVPAGTLQIRYKRPGYFAPGSRQEEAVRTLSFVPGGSEPVFALEPAATLQGQVVSPDGEPPSGIRVDLYQAAVLAGHRYWRQRESTQVESDGSFEFARLEPGSYLLHSQASLDPMAARQPDRQPRSGYVPVFAPEARDIAAASAIILLPGQTAEARLNLVRAVFWPVSVQVAGAPDGAFPSFEVSGSGFTHWPVRFDRQTDALTVDLPSGNYVLHASGNRRNTASGSLPLHIAEGAPPAALSVTVSQASPITVTVHSVSTATATTGSPMRLSSLTLLSADTPDAQPISLQLEQDQDGGTATIRNSIPPGRYWVQPTASGGYVAQFTSQGTDLLAEPLTVSSSGMPAMDVVLRDDGGSISLQWQGNLASTESVVQLIPLFAGGVERTYINSLGGNTGEPTNFSFTDLAPGDYLVLATSTQAGIAYREPGILQQLKGTRVTVTAGASTQATLSTLSDPPPGTTGAL